MVTYTYLEKSPTLAAGDIWQVTASIRQPTTVSVTSSGAPVEVAWSVDASTGIVSIPVTSAVAEGQWEAAVQGARAEVERPATRALFGPVLRSGYTQWASGFYHSTSRDQSGVHPWEVGRGHAGDLVCRVSVETRQGWGDPATPGTSGMAWNTYAMRSISKSQLGQQVIGMAIYPSNIGVAHDTAGQAAMHDRIIGGEFDAVYQQIARNLTDSGLGTAIVRIDWEANASWYTHGTQQVAYAAKHGQAVAHVAAVMLAVAPGLKFTLDVSSHNWLPSGTPQEWLAAYYPQQYAPAGVTVTHLVLCDIYFTWDKNIGTSPTWAQFNAMLRPTDPQKGVTLAHCADFAAAKNLPLAIGEWGISDTNHNGTGDAPAYIEHMWRWCNETPELAYESYWILGDSSVNDLQTDLRTLHPQSWAKYVELWGEPPYQENESAMADRFNTYPESYWDYMSKPLKLLSDDLKAVEVGGGGAGTASVMQTWTTPGTSTWTIPDGVTQLSVTCIGGGGGGGGGRRGAAGTVRCGGGGGGGAASTSTTLTASTLTSQTLTIVVGSGGAGAAAVTTDDTNGRYGSNGGDSIVYSGTEQVESAVIARASCGYSGNGGSSTAGAGGAGGMGGFGGSAGGSANTSGSGGISSSPSSGATGGGSGAGLTSANAVSGGGGGGAVTTRTGVAQSGPSANGGNGSEGRSWSALSGPAHGGGGCGGASSSTSGGNGGAGGAHGGGGGGGAAAVNGSAPGSGGDGAHGAIVIIYS